MGKLSPMMKEYVKTKEEYSDCILFYRLGDFYEMFFDDALTASKELEITLTGKNCGLEERAPMCGVPYHAVESYLDRLVSKGYKVARKRTGKAGCRAHRHPRHQLRRSGAGGIQKQLSDVRCLFYRKNRAIHRGCYNRGLLCDRGGGRQKAAG